MNFKLVDTMSTTAKKVAEYLLQIKAIKLQPTNPFTWASGWNSPIYCDNRKTLSYPEVRDYIRDAFAKEIEEKYGDCDVIAGVATGAIAQGVLVAQALNKPFVYIRSSAKAHGLENKIEGYYEAGQKVVVIEDLVSTGGSSLQAVEALRSAGCEVLGMMAIFTYGFPVAEDNFKKAECKLDTLSNYNSMVELALETGYIKEEDVENLKEWRKAPQDWGK
ncbi:MAG: orotate phosphoribosyltransferase [Marinifilaceae bacterium]|jgi:orotate phosphoribosyltransferase|nr:orotate phosphoribosyltransferase [Marinifilaceae bacterium]